MPKITGPNIAQHVADQEAAVFAAAIALFGSQGVDAVSMGAIATDVGLARSSLYRYFPNKAAIVDRWFSTAMQPLIDDSARIAGSGRSRAERFTLWVELQLAFLSDPANRTMIHAALETNEMSGDQRAHILARHRDLYHTLHQIISEGGAKDDDATHARVRLVVGLLRNIDALLAADVPARVAHDEVVRAATLTAGIDQH